MKKEKTGNGKKNTDGIRKELIIAGIGLFGTILAAVISVWGNWAQSKMIINATQTVEAIFNLHRKRWQPELGTSVRRCDTQSRIRNYQ